MSGSHCPAKLSLSECVAPRSWCSQEHLRLRGMESKLLASGIIQTASLIFRATSALASSVMSDSILSVLRANALLQRHDLALALMLQYFVKGRAFSSSLLLSMLIQQSRKLAGISYHTASEMWRDYIAVTLARKRVFLCWTAGELETGPSGSEGIQLK